VARGEYPRPLDGLCKLLSLDMRVMDPAWIGMKLRKLLDFPEPLGDFMAFVPAAASSRPILDGRLPGAADRAPLRHARHPDEEGFPRTQMGILESPSAKASRRWPARPAPSAATARSSAGTAATTAPPAAT